MKRETQLRKAKNILAYLHEWESITFSQKPRRMMLLIIGLSNLVLILVSAWVISTFGISGNEKLGFFAAAYNTFTMILDAGCIETIITDPGSANLFLIMFCLIVIVISMITFTGALIGYVTDFISSKIENANLNSRELKISNHVVILGWNTRSSEMVNDLLYCPDRQKVVVLTDGDRDEIQREVEERIMDTIERENAELWNSLLKEPLLKRLLIMHKRKLRNNLIFIVREGDIYSSIQLRNIQLEKAKAIIILSDNSRKQETVYELGNGTVKTGDSDNRTVKTLMQVVDIASRYSSNDDQKVVVEVDNDWTETLVRKIIKNKQAIGKCRVVPFRVHRVMGQLLCQFALMPELNMVYRELFSNKGSTFYALPQKSQEDPASFISGYLRNHHHAIPLSTMKDDLEDVRYHYYMSDREKDIDIISEESDPACELTLNDKYWINEKYVLILGCNSKITNILSSFSAFSEEWTDESHEQIVHVTIVDENEAFFRRIVQEYPFVNYIKAEISDEKEIGSAITDFIYSHPDNSSILILSDDNADSENTDAKALTYLIYAKDMISRARVNRKDETINIDIIVEIVDPKHFDIVKSYDINNVVISNRYISKMITQISENYALYSFYADIMKYDDGNSSGFSSKEVYIKRAGDYYGVLPGKESPVLSVIKSTYEASKGFWLSKDDFAILIGYVDARGMMHLFGGNLAEQTVSLTPDDKLIIFSNH